LSNANGSVFGVASHAERQREGSLLPVSEDRAVGGGGRDALAERLEKLETLTDTALTRAKASGSRSALGSPVGSRQPSNRCGWIAWMKQQSRTRSYGKRASG
jgi:hypothetical protein